jgi:hypothetical protein
MRIDAARQGALSIYDDCHCRSFSFESVKGWHHRWDGGIVRGRPALTGRPITPPDQWCRVNLDLGRRTNVRPFGVSSQAEAQVCPTVTVRPHRLVDAPTGRHSPTLHAGNETL